MSRRLSLSGAMQIGTIAAALLLAAGATPAAAQSAESGTPPEMVATYNTLADGLLALKRTEENLVKSILAASKAHGEVQLMRAKRSITPPAPRPRSRRLPPTSPSSAPRATTPWAPCASG